MGDGSLLLVGATCSDAATELLNSRVVRDAGISVKAEIRTRVCVVSGANACSFVTVKFEADMLCATGVSVVTCCYRVVQ